MARAVLKLVYLESLLGGAFETLSGGAHGRYWVALSKRYRVALMVVTGWRSTAMIRHTYLDTFSAPIKALKMLENRTIEKSFWSKTQETVKNSEGGAKTSVLKRWLC